MDNMMGVLRQSLTQDRARTNAAQAARRLVDERREREAVEAYVEHRVGSYRHPTRPRGRAGHRHDEDARSHGP